MRDNVSDGHIVLRRYRVGDEFALCEGISESTEELTRWGFFCQVAFALEDAKADVVSRIQDWREGRAYSFLIEEVPGLLFVGNCRIEEFEPERNHASLGWWVRTSKTGKGIATAAGRLVAQAAFEDLNLTSLSVYTNVDNSASRRVAEKIGAVLVRIKPEDDGGYCAVYELRPEDPQEE